MRGLRSLGISAAVLAIILFEVSNLDVGSIGSGMAVIGSFGFGAYAGSLMWKMMKLNAMKHQFMTDPELGEEAFQEVVDDMAVWSRGQFGKLTNVAFVGTITLAGAIWAPVFLGA